MPLMHRLVERETGKLETEKGAMTRRIRPLGAGFEPGSPVVRTVASTNGAGALPTEPNSAQRVHLLI